MWSARSGMLRVPLKTDKGDPVGTVCLHESRLHPWTDGLATGVTTVIAAMSP